MFGAARKRLSLTQVTALRNIIGGKNHNRSNSSLDQKSPATAPHGFSCLIRSRHRSTNPVTSRHKFTRPTGPIGGPCDVRATSTIATGQGGGVTKLTQFVCTYTRQGRRRLSSRKKRPVSAERKRVYIRHLLLARDIASERHPRGWLTSLKKILIPTRFNGNIAFLALPSLLDAIQSKALPPSIEGTDRATY